MRILINAYACSPTWGSEPGMGWNWISNLAKYCDLHIITEGEWKAEIEKELLSHPYAKKLHFYYLPVSARIRKMCWNQGDWRFYFFYNKWQKRALELARDIVKKEKIDVIHQLNMVGFREPGYLWKIDCPFVWGPIGGMGDVPIRYLEGDSIKTKLKLRIKNVISNCQLKYSPQIDKAFRKSSVVIAAVPIVVRKVKEIKGIDTILINETGCYELSSDIVDKTKRAGLQILWVGRFIYTKRLDIALKTISKVKSLSDITFHIVGTGSEQEVKHYKQLAKDLGIEEICIWYGKVTNKEVHEMMRNVDLFFFTSIMEATSTVVPEAINNGLPILCFNTCGFGPLVTDRIGRRIELTTPNDSIDKFAEQIKILYQDKEILHQMSLNCKEEIKKLLWENKARLLLSIYGSLISK